MRGEWISVTGELPPFFQNVLAVLFVGEYRTRVIAFRGGGDRWRYTFNGELCSSVTHWMPLPELPPAEDVK